MANIVPGYLDASSLDFNDLKTSLKTFLSQQAQFADFNFEGSNLSVLLDLLAYNTSMQALYTNLVGSEMFLDSAQLRESIVSHAKELNYVPQSRTSAFAMMNLQLAGNNIPGVVTLPTGFAINGIGTQGSSMQFVTDTVSVLSAENNWTTNATFYEGRIISETFVNTSNANTPAVFTLASANVDTSSIQVVVQNSTSDTTNTVWLAGDWATTHSGNDAVWFLQGYKDDYYQLVFGNGTIGRSLVPGNVLNVSYRETSGVGGNGISSFTPLSNTGISGVSIVLSGASANTISTGGNERESNTSIQFAAPRFMQSQGRAVTAADYEALMEDKFPQFQTVSAYGGENAFPQKQYGAIIVSGKLAGMDYVPPSLVTPVLAYMQSLAPLGLTVKFAQPDVYTLQLDCRIIYNPLQSSMTYAELIAAITNAIQDFDATNLNIFGNSLWSSQLENAIVAVDRSILTADFSVYMATTQQIVGGTSRAFSFSYQNPVFYPFTSIQSYPANYDPAFSSSPVVVGGIPAMLTDDGTGTINLVNASNNSIVLSRSVGTIDYSTGDVSITPIVITSSQDSQITFVARMQTEDVQAGPSQILSIDTNQTTIHLTTQPQ